MKRVALITGASSGIGKSAATELLNKGYIVYGAARRIEKMRELSEKGAKIISLDITKEESIVNCVNTILKNEGCIDILVNNAGYGSYGAVEDVSMKEARRQFDVNVFGLARLTQLVLPTMRENRFGRIINVSSIGGKIYSPFGAWYHATKHALEGFSDAMRLETKDFGIDVVIIEPGGVKTDWGLISAENPKKTSGNGAYAHKANKTANGLTDMYSSNRLSDPFIIGKVILKAATVRRPKTRYSAGHLSGLALFARKWLSDRMFDRMVTAMV